VHRFTRTDATGRTTPDIDYADLTLAIRAAENPGKVFDALSPAARSGCTPTVRRCGRRWPRPSSSTTVRAIA
jgi:hypothetical protein